MVRMHTHFGPTVAFSRVHLQMSTHHLTCMSIYITFSLQFHMNSFLAHFHFELILIDGDNKDGSQSKLSIPDFPVAMHSRVMMGPMRYITPSTANCYIQSHICSQSVQCVLLLYAGGELNDRVVGHLPIILV